MPAGPGPACLGLEHRREVQVLGVWFNLVAEAMELGFDAQRVIALRFVKIADGGSAANEEARLMVTEKLAAAGEAVTTLLMGGSGQAVVQRYRSHMRANARRLAGK
jgi:hypothetical protein